MPSIRKSSCARACGSVPARLRQAWNSKISKTTPCKVEWGGPDLISFHSEARKIVRHDVGGRQDRTSLQQKLSQATSRKRRSAMEPTSCLEIPFVCIASSPPSRRRFFAPSSMPMPWPNGCRPTASPARSTNSTPRSAAHSGCRSRISRPATAIRSAASIWRSCRTSASATRINSTIPICPASSRSP